MCSRIIVFHKHFNGVRITKSVNCFIAKIVFSSSHSLNAPLGLQCLSWELGEGPLLLYSRALSSLSLIKGTPTSLMATYVVPTYVIPCHYSAYKLGIALLDTICTIWETMYQSNDHKITFNYGLITLKTKSGKEVLSVEGFFSWRVLAHFCKSVNCLETDINRLNHKV